MYILPKVLDVNIPMVSTSASETEIAHILYNVFVNPGVYIEFKMSPSQALRGNAVMFLCKW